MMKFNLKSLVGGVMAAMAFTLAIGMSHPADAQVMATFEPAPIGGISVSNPEEELPLRLQSQQLRIQYNRIESNYRFQNLGDEEVKPVLELKFPDLPADDYFNTAWPPASPNHFNFIDLNVSVQDEPISFHKRLGATVKGKSYLTYLNLRNIPVSPFDPSLKTIMHYLPERSFNDFLEKGLVMDGFHDPIPMWVFELRLQWPQTWPAKESIAVKSSYAPMYGQSTLSLQELQDRREWKCMNPQAQDTLTQAAQNNDSFLVRTLEYDFKADASWSGSGPAEADEWLLTVDEAPEGQFLAMCTPKGLESLQTSEAPYQYPAQYTVKTLNLKQSLPEFLTILYIEPVPAP